MFKVQFKMYGAAGTFDPATGSNQDAFDAGIITATELSKINGLYGQSLKVKEQFITNLPFMGDLDDAQSGCPKWFCSNS